MKKILVEIVWCVVLYFGGCTITGAVGGMMAGSSCHDTATAARVGREAGAKIVTDNRAYIGIGALVLTAIGSCAGIFPGTRED